MTHEEILRYCDHTLLRVDARWEEIRKICDEGMQFGTASVCIPARFVKQAVEYVEGKLPICTVIGFPSGYSTTAVKVFETMTAVQEGAAEIDMVIPVGLAKEGQFDAIEDEIRQVKEACGDKLLKVIIETCLLTDEEKIALCGAVSRAGAEYIKTSTGFSTHGATVPDVALMAAHVAAGVKVKAAGGIRSWEDAEAMIAAGASRLGTSALVKLAQKEQA